MTEEKMEKFLAFCLKEGFDISSPDSAQRKAIISPLCSVLPSGAGSGKTTVLAYRFLRLIMDGVHSDEILTITFTKAATANMRARIYLILKKAEQEGLIDANEIKRFSSSEISTTDSFCSKIARLDSIRYGITPSFKIEDNEDIENFVRNTLEKIMEEKIKTEEEVAVIASLVSFDTLLSAMLEFTYNYLNIASPFECDSLALYERMKNETKEVILNTLENEKEKLISRLDSFIEKYSPYESVVDDTTHAKNIKKFLDENSCVLSSFSRKRSVKENSSLSDSFQKERKEIKESFSFYSECLEYSDDQSFTLLKGYASIIQSLEKEIIKHKREEGLLTFHDVMLLSIDILRTNPDLRLYYNRKFKRIMVDEFQDNNDENRKLIYLLAAKEDFTSNTSYPEIDDIIIDKVFMVGDEKQSIYKFRGADVSVFKNIEKDFGKDRVLALSENFRSEKTLIDKINRIFSDRIMPRKNEDNPDYEAEYTPLISRRERVPSSISFRYMNVRKYESEKENRYALSSPESEAYECARIIKEEILTSQKEKYMVWDNKQKSLRYPKYDDIAILLKKTTNQSQFEKALRHFNIPFNVTDNKSLTTECVCNDFYSIMQYSIYGDDDPLSLLSVLRSPFVNMSDEAIERIAFNLKNNIKKEEGLEEKEKDKLNYFYSLLSGLKALETGSSISAIIHYLWFDLGYRYSIETESGNENYSEHYDYLYSAAVDAEKNNRNLVEFLERLRPKLGKVSDYKDLAVLKEDRRGVTIETIHKSKGLEYPIVIVSDIAGKNAGNKFVVSALPSGLPLFPYYLTDEGKLKNTLSVVTKKEDNKIENAETKRVLYVAATRSMHHLIFTSVLGKTGVKDDGIVKRPQKESYNSMLQYLVEGIDFTLENGSPLIETIEYERRDYSVYREREKKKKTKIKKEWYESEREYEEKRERERIGVTELIKEDSTLSGGERLSELPSDKILRRGSSAEESEDRITSFGTLVHYLIECAIKKEDEDLSQYFKDDRERDEIIECAYLLKNNFLSSPFYKTLLAYELFPERKFLIKDGDYIVEGIIDLLCVSKEKIIIVDYKTDSVKDKEKHRLQLEYYKKALSTIYSGKEIETYLFYLRSSEPVLLD